MNNTPVRPENPAIPQIHALVPCAGSGSRAGRKQPKQYEQLAGRPMVAHSLDALLAVTEITRVLLVTAPGDKQAAALLQPLPERLVLAPCGGASRAESVFNGLSWLLGQGTAERDWVLVHDAARCLVRPAQVRALVEACLPDTVGGLLALPLPDTLKQAQHGRVQRTCPRVRKWLAQTPQMFRLGALHAALANGQATGFAGMTDEASAMEQAGCQPLLVRGSAHNIKVTYPEDFALAEAVLRSRMP